MSFNNFLSKYEREIVTLRVFIIWMVLYFSTNYLSQFRNYTTLELPIDRLIPFVPFFVIFYIASVFVTFVPYFVVKKIEDYRKVAKLYLFIIIVSCIIYLIIPVKATRPEFIPTNIFGSLVAFIYAKILPYNLFPSLHVSLNLTATLVSLKYKRILGYALVPITLGIMISTLFIKQHYLVDLIAAIIISFVFYYYFFNVACASTAR
jgi:membrane-associated phospholipid phosphatase